VVASLLYSLVRFVLDVVATSRADRAKLEGEVVLALRRQVQVLERQVKRVRWSPGDRMIMAALRERLPRSAWAGLLVRPETVLGWHRALVRRKWAAYRGRPRRDSRRSPSSPCGDHIFIRGQATRSRVACPIGFRPPMIVALAYLLLRLLLDLVDVRLRVHDPEAELLLLRHQLRVVRRQVKRPQLTMADRTIMSALSQLVNRAALAGMLVQPETVLRWHRELVRRKWAAFGRRRGPGRPSLDPEIQNLILQMAKDNPRWGCVRVRGELLKLGHVVSATTIRNLLRRNRVGPAPLRSQHTWKAFLRAQASAIVLTDFFTVDTVFLRRTTSFYIWSWRRGG